MRSYKPKAYAELSPYWADRICGYYRDSGHDVEIGWTNEERTKAWIRVHGVTQHELCCYLNDPLGKPGEQDPRNVESTIKKYKRKQKPLPPWEREHLWQWEKEELRYLRYDDSEEEGLCNEQ